MIAAEHILKEYEEAQGKKEAIPWTKPLRSVKLMTINAYIC